jgi:LuxR family maltose regulon positive regulatory protein
MGLVPTTIVPPRSSHIIIERPTLEAFFEAIDRSRLTMVSAPAGSGKTTAALCWFRHLKAAGRPGLWLAARAGIRDLSSFLLALQSAGIEAGLPWQDIDPQGADDAWLAALANAKACEARPVLVIDDAQLLPPAAIDFLAQAIASARDAVTIIIISRGALAIPVARTRALGFLVEIGAADLHFDREEATELVSRTVGAPLDAKEMQEIVADAHGWASGLVIAGELYRRDIMRGSTWKPLLGNLRSEFTSYFHEEVLSLQTPAVRDFLVNTSILTELTAPACAAVTNDDDARAMLDEVYRAGLFLNAIDEERSRYAYHPLFKEMVLGRLAERAPARAAELHRRASLHFADQGDQLTALRHAQASGDKEFLANQLDTVANDLIYAGYLYRIEELSSDIPWSVMRTRPTLLLALAWRRIRRLSFASASRLIDAAVAIRDERLADGRLDSHAAETFDLLLRHRRLMLEAARDNMVAIEQDAERLLYDLGDEHPYLSCTLLAQLMAARRELYHFQDILKLEAETRRALDRADTDFASIALKSSIAPTLMARGNTAVARRFLDEAFAAAQQRDDLGFGLAALPALPLAELLYEAGDLDQASELVERYLPAVRQWGFVDQLASGFLVRAKLAFARGDVNAALVGLDEAHLIAIECGLDRLRAFVVAEQVRILIKTGQLVEAEAAMVAGDVGTDHEPVPTLNPTRQNESIAIAWIRIEMQRHRLVRARKVASRWLDLLKRAGAIRSAVTFELLLAEISVLQGNRSKARRAVRSAVEMAESAGWVRLFLDEGEVISTLLSEAYAHGPVLDTPADKFAARLVSLVNGSATVGAEEEDDGETFGLSSRLASREIDILTMVGGGLRNREIGDRLGLTEGTVKWYMQQIYDKLGVRRRPQAVLRARQFGLLV